MAGAQTALGIGQTIAGLVKKKPEIPEYDIPAEVYENMTDAEYWALQGLPKEHIEQFIQESKRTGATALSRSADRKGGLGLVSSIAQQERDDTTELLKTKATAAMSGLDRLFAARDTVSQQEGIKQEWAKEKTMAKRDEINALPGAGLQNIMGAGGTFAGLDSASDSAGGIFEDLFGTKDSRTAKRDWRKEQKSA
jgi:hypothetical protein